jgi:hypothetical protein
MTKAVAIKNENAGALANVDEAFFGSVSQFDGAGSEDVTMADRKVPIYALVEPLSKALKKNNSKFIEGATVGDIIDTSVRSIVGQSFDFIPVKFTTEWQEWQEGKEGTPPTRHMSGDIMNETTAKYDGDKFKGNYLPNGNRVSETKIFYGIDITNGNWAVIPLSGGRFGEAKDWVEKLERIKNPVTGKKAAYFIQVWEVFSKDKTSLGGDDYKTWGTRFKCWVNEYEGGMDAFEQAKELAEALAKNEVKTDYESFSAEAASEKTEDAAF